MKIFKPVIINGWKHVMLVRALSGGQAIFKDGKIVDTQMTTREISDREKWGRSSEQARSLLEFQNRVIDTAVVWINILNKHGSVTLWRARVRTDCENS